MLAQLEKIDAAPAQDHQHPLDEREAWRLGLIDMRKFWSDTPPTYRIEYEGFVYDCAIWTLDRREGETFFEFYYFEKKENGHIMTTACPLSRRGHTTEFQYGKVKPEDARATTEKVLIAWIEKMKPIRILQDGDIITQADI